MSDDAIRGKFNVDLSGPGPSGTHRSPEAALRASHVTWL